MTDIEYEQALKGYRDIVKKWKEGKVPIVIDGEKKMLLDIIKDLLIKSMKDPKGALMMAIETLKQIAIQIPELPKAFDEIVLRFDMAMDKSEILIKEKNNKIDQLETEKNRLKGELEIPESFKNIKNIMLFAKQMAGDYDPHEPYSLEEIGGLKPRELEADEEPNGKERGEVKTFTEDEWREKLKGKKIKSVQMFIKHHLDQEKTIRKIALEIANVTPEQLETMKIPSW